MLKSKIHQATVTEANIEYEGSITLDEELMKAANIAPYERVQVLSIDTGERLETYAIAGEKESGIVAMNGAAARAIKKGEKVIILAYQWLEEKLVPNWQPIQVFVSEDNRLVYVKRPSLLASN
jgi:aspartate 1-decarboxylase